MKLRKLLSTTLFLFMANAGMANAQTALLTRADLASATGAAGEVKMKEKASESTAKATAQAVAGASNLRDDVQLVPLYNPTLEPSSRRPISSKPFAYRDPKTGKEISAATLIENPKGKKVSAGELYSELNQQEKFLSSLGYDLQKGEDEDLGTIQRPLSTKGLVAAQTQEILSAIDAPQIALSDLDSYSRPNLTDTTTLEIGNRATIPSSAVGGAIKLPASGLNADAIGALTGGVKAAKCTSKDRLRRPMNWDKRLGDSSFNLELGAGLLFEATCDRVAGSSTGNFNGTIFGKGFNVARANLVGEAVRNQHYAVNLDVYIVGKKVFDYDKTQKNAFSKSSSYGNSIAKDYSVKIPIGPVNLALTVGVRGSANFAYTLKFDGLSALASVEPNASASVYAEAGLNAIVIEAGAGANFVLLKIKIPLSALAEVVPRGNSFQAHGKLFGYLGLTALSGNIYVYVKVWVPRWGIPPWKQKKYSKDIVNWNGYGLNFTLFNDDRWIKLI